MNTKVIHIHDIVRGPGSLRLGRHVEHDQRSRCYAYAIQMTSAPLVSVDWQRHCPPFEQGDLGSCTGNAMAGALMTGPLFDARDRPYAPLTEKDAVTLYEAATRLDKIPGHYLPDDTGSSGLAVAKAAQRAGYIRAYHHAFGLNAALHALSRAPILTGINWYEGFDHPVGARAEVRIGGVVRGGHEVVLDAIDVKAGLVRGTNSWGDTWGDAGRFTMTFGTFGRLLKESGDVIVLVP